ncbi:hypothetical protein HWV62_23204 [Athelia sp. TMB]|nr:hypothetical protein HWV62_23204 [Athelia sp. TMB]
MLPSILPLVLFLRIQPASSLAVDVSSLLNASAVSALSPAVSITTISSTETCDNIHTCRTLYSIVQTCLATIFACVWVAVHRNIPGPKARASRSSNLVISSAQWLWATILDQRQSVIVFLVTLLVPEWILAWAIRQAILAQQLTTELEDARRDAKELWEKGIAEHAAERNAEKPEEGNRSTGVSMRGSSEDEAPLIERRLASSNMNVMDPEDRLAWTHAKRFAKLSQAWTIVHAFFVIMGGYHAYDEDGPLYPLDPDEVVSLVRDGKLIPPSTDELANQSKGDFLSKGIAILQTIWFVVQCLARLAEHLPITNLEVMTLAYTVMTVAMYVAWWHKPLNISCAIRAPAVASEKQVEVKVAWERFLNYVMGSPDDDVDLRSLQRVPTFWAGQPDIDDVTKADAIALVVAMAFGAVHCLAWDYTFASHTERLLWRVSAVAIIAVPAGILLFLLLIKIERWGFEYVGGILGVVFVFVGAPLYICARTILLVFSFTTLTSLPHSIYQIVQWTEFIPHI